MKQKATDSDQITKADLKAMLNDFRDQILYAVDVKIDNKTEELREEHRSYRDETMTRFDGVMAKLVNAREERAFLFHENKQLSKTTDNHEKRITKLEQS